MTNCFVRLKSKSACASGRGNGAMGPSCGTIWHGRIFLSDATESLAPGALRCFVLYANA